MRKNEYVLIVIGAGSGGLGMLNLGFRVLLIDKKAANFGGECVDTGCMPSKALIHVAKQIHQATTASRFGLKSKGNINKNLAGNQIVKEITLDEKDFGKMVSFKGMIVSVIIPTLNEEHYISETLSCIKSLPGDFEIIVVNGGSVDATVEIVSGHKGIEVVTSEKGRARQMKKGAALAKGEILLFLHADTFLPANAYPVIMDHLKESHTIGGSFYLNLDKKHLFLRFYSWCSKLSLEFFTYGDHAIFVRKNVFISIGGYKPLIFMEDVEIQKRLRSAG